MARLTTLQNEQLKIKLGVNKLWSFSSINSYMTNKYEYFLKRIKHIEPDRDDGIYSTTGSIAHDILEQYYEDKITREQMLETWNSRFLDVLVQGKKFDRTDPDKNLITQNKYDISLVHFFSHHFKPLCTVRNEMTIITKIDPKLYFIGYIDLITASDNMIIITDFKTSSIYSGDDLKEKSTQLYIYAEGVRQRMGLEDFDHIKVCYNFLKYVNIDVAQKNGATKTRSIERCKIGSSLQSSISSWLKETVQIGGQKGKHCLYTEEEISHYLQEVLDTNSIECLPKDIQNKYSIADCIMYIPLNTELVESCKILLQNEVKKAEEDEALYAVTQDENIWWVDIDERNSFFAKNLSGYSPKLNKPYKEYLIKSGKWKEYTQADNLTINNQNKE